MIVRDPNISGGRPILQGTRIEVLFLQKLRAVNGWDVDRILGEYPHLRREEVQEALAWRAEPLRPLRPKVTTKKHG